MSLIDRWNKFAKRNIYINDTIEIGCGRLVLALILMILGAFEVPIAWLMPLLAVKKSKKEKKKGD